MNSYEREQLTKLLGQLTEVRLTERDPEAEAMIREAAARQPDAAYLLVQRAILVEQALSAAKAKIEELQRSDRAGMASAGGGFLRGQNPWAPPASAVQASGASASRVPGVAPMSGTSPVGGGGLGGGFLGNVASTAAGVVAGSFLFQGLENLLGHHSVGGTPWGDSGSEQLSEQTVINNYYGASSDPGFNTDVGTNGGASLASEVDEDFPDDGADNGDWV